LFPCWLVVITVISPGGSTARSPSSKADTGSDAVVSAVSIAFPTVAIAAMTRNVKPSRRRSRVFTICGSTFVGESQ